jgi:hypothetical protein
MQAITITVKRCSANRFFSTNITPFTVTEKRMNVRVYSPQKTGITGKVVLG